MSTSPGSCDSSKKCEICDQAGLPIMPLRYAVAMTDVAAEYQAPSLNAPFGDGVTDVTALPDSLAKYTLRPIRTGYLYVFNEVRGEWKAYQVTDDGYLLEFDIHTDSPPPLEDYTPTCRRMADSQVARCVVIPDPKRAGNVWFGFSDTAWTADVLEKHKRQSYRERHMRRIHVGQWVSSSGETFPHAAPLSQLGERVGEFHFAAPLPPAVSERANDIPVIGPVMHLIGVTVVPNPAYDHSLQPFFRCRQQLEGFLAWAAAAAGQATPMMLALNDPVGIALELSALMQTHVERFERQEDRAWKHATSVAIQGIRKALEDDAAAKALQRQQMMIDAYSMDEYGRPIDMTQYVTEEQKARWEDDYNTLPASEDAEARADAWDRYKDDYNEQRRTAFDNKLEAEMKALAEGVLTDLAHPFVCWYRSDIYHYVMECNHDDADIRSGSSFTVIAALCVQDIVGHKIVSDAILEELQGDYTDRANIAMRALALNNSEAAQILQRNSTSELELGNAGAWGNVMKAFGHVAEKGQELSGALENVARYVYAVSGPIIAALGKVRDGVAGSVAGLAVRYRMMGVLGTLAGRPLRRLPIRASEAEMAHFIVEALTEGKPGANRQQLRRQVNRHLREQLSQRNGTRTPTGTRNARNRRVFHWSVFLDESTARALRGIDPGQLGDVLLTEDQMRALVRRQTSTRVSVDIGFGVVGLILDGWNIQQALSQLDDETKGTEEQRELNLVAAGVGMVASSVEITGTILGRTAWGRMPLSRPFSVFAAKVTTQAALVGFVGKAIGVVGAVMSAVLDGWRAAEAIRQGDIPMAILYGTTALAGAAVAFLMLFGFMSAGVGFVVLIVLAVLALLGEWLINLFRDNKLEIWLSKTPFGTYEHGRFGDFPEQEKAWEALMSQGAK